MRRRTLLAMVTVGLFAVPHAIEAQQAGRIARVGFLSVSPPTNPVGQGPFYERLRELGWTYGRDLVVEHRAYGDRLDRVGDLAAELLRMGVDVFVVGGASDAVRVQQVTQIVPIVTYGAGDLVAAGVAVSLAKPGRNVTGIQTLQPELVSKHLSLLKEAIPRFSQAGLLLYRSTSSPGPAGSDVAVLREAEAGGRALDIALQITTVHGADGLEGAFSRFQAARAQAVIVVRNQFVGAHLQALLGLALKHRLPTISDFAAFARRGGLMSYGHNFDDALRSAAGVVDKILRGAKASEIPIQQVTTFRLVINLKTAKALGLTIPPSLTLRADEVIQ